MKVFTFFATVPGHEDPKLMELWVKSWEAAGFDPHVYEMKDAWEANPQAYERLIRSPLLKTGNAPAYERACLVRWLPLTLHSEPTLAVDWDVFPTPITRRFVDGLEGKGFPALFLAGGRCPCAVYAQPRGMALLAAALEVMPYTPDFKPEELAKNASDQYAFNIMPSSWAESHPEQPCALYEPHPEKEDEWRDWHFAPMVHFANRTTPYPRSNTVQMLGL